MEAVGFEQDRPDVFIRQHSFSLQSAPGGQHTVEGRLRFHDPLCAAMRQVIFDEMGKLVVHEFQLGFVDSDNEGRQPDARSSILFFEPKHAAPHQVKELFAGLIDRQPIPLGKFVKWFVGAVKLACQGSFLG